MSEAIYLRFVDPVFRAFRRPALTEDEMALLMQDYHRMLSGFTEADLQSGCNYLLAYRRDPFLPTIAECIDACERAKCNRLGLPYETPEERQKRDAEEWRQLNSFASKPEKYRHARPRED